MPGWTPTVYRNKEVYAAWTSTKRGKAPDESCVVVELLKGGGLVARQVLVMILSAVLFMNLLPPKEWRESRIIAMINNGDKHQPD